MSRYHHPFDRLLGECLIMRKVWNLISIGGLILLLLTQFNNCDVYSDSSLFNGTSSLNSSGSTVGCIEPELYPNEPCPLELRLNSDTDVPISAAVRDFNLGGDCNEGGFSENVIKWELYYNGTLVRNSTTVLADSVCDRGKFSLYVILGNTSEDSTDRTGLVVPNSGGARAQHVLYVEIYGKQDGVEYKNSLMGRKRVYLNPI